MGRVETRFGRASMRWNALTDPSNGDLTSIEICAGAGGQAIGIERAGFRHVALIELDRWACRTLKQNRPNWNIIEQDVRSFSAKNLSGVDLLAGGVPCPPFSVAGHRLGDLDERDLFPEALRLIEEARPRAVMLENVRGLLAPEFASYRESIRSRLRDLEYVSEWRLLHASDFQVPQLRPRAILVAFRIGEFMNFRWPPPEAIPPRTVGEALLEEMASAGWEHAVDWAANAQGIAPTLVGGSKKHGGPDLGPTRAREAWAKLGVDGRGLADKPPPPGFSGMPKLTVTMTAIIQGFPANWKFAGGKTAAYRQVGNAFPPPVAGAVGTSIASALRRDPAGSGEEETTFPTPAPARQLSLLEVA